MIEIEVRPKGGQKFKMEVDRVPVAGDYLYVQGQLGRVPAVVLPESGPPVVYLRKDPDGMPDEL